MLCLTFTSNIKACDETVITATRLPTPAERIGSNVMVITTDNIERNKHRSISDALIGVPSLSIIRSGGIGKLTNIFSRDSESNHMRYRVR